MSSTLSVIRLFVLALAILVGKESAEVLKRTNTTYYPLAEGHSVFLAYELINEYKAVLSVNESTTPTHTQYTFLDPRIRISNVSQYNSEDKIYVADLYDTLDDHTLVFIVVTNGRAASNTDWLVADILDPSTEGNYTYHICFEHPDNPCSSSQTTLTPPQPTPPGSISELVEKLPNRSNITVEVQETVEVSFLVTFPYDQVELLLECHFNEGSYPSIVFDNSNISVIYDQMNDTHPLLQINGKHIGSDRHSLITIKITNNDAAKNVTEMTLSLTAYFTPSPELLMTATYNIMYKKSRTVKLFEISDDIAAATAAVEMLQTTIEKDKSNSSILLIIILVFTVGHAGFKLVAGTIRCLYHCWPILKKCLTRNPNKTTETKELVPNIWKLNKVHNKN